MIKMISSTMILMFFMLGAVSAMENEITTKEWSNDNILVKAAIATTNKDISKGLLFNLDITNKSSNDIRIMFVKGDNPESFLSYNFINLTLKSDVKLNDKVKKAKIPPLGKLSFIFIKPETTYSLKINLLDRFIVEKKQSYSLGLKGILYLNDGSNCAFTVENLTFAVE